MANISGGGGAVTAKAITVALVGNPNAGKTTVFNNLTGTRQRVANYPGVTVERKEGRCTHRGVAMQVVDLPGTYSLTAYSIEEIIARDYVVDEKPDVVVDIVDAANLERNLYLATQLLELGVPLVLAFNMSDLARSRGYEFDLDALSRFFGAPIVPTVGNRKTGMEALLDAILRVADGRGPAAAGPVRYGAEVEEELARLTPLVEAQPALAARYPPRWAALKLLENDGEIRDRVRALAAQPDAILDAAKASGDHLAEIFGDNPEIVIADRRYGFISGACQETVRSTVEARHSMSDRIDSVVTHPLVGLPIFLAMMYLVFQLTFALGRPPMEWIEAGFGWLAGALAGLWPEGADSPLRALLVEGVIGGVGGVVVFLPNILLLFLGIAFLEDSGYMARAAFIMDRWMHKIGLHGKSFIPMLIGFGCSVPAILATRTLESRRDRLTTMLVLPLMSCGARLPIYLLIIPAFFADRALLDLGLLTLRTHAVLMWAIYLIGILLAVACAKLLRVTALRGASTPFVMELPPYRLPTLKGVLIHMWQRGWAYIRKAGTLLLGFSIVFWAMTTYPKKTAFERDYDAERAAAQTEAGRQAVEQARQAEAMAYSVTGRIGRGLEPVLRPMGFDWRIGTSLLGALAAKEMFVAQLGIVYAVGEGEGSTVSLQAVLRETYTPLVGFCIMLFCLVSAPCVATIAATRKESGSWGWALFQLGGLTALAYALTALVYQAGRLLDIGTRLAAGAG
jgi:ferrous iron transport protein B